VKFCVGSLVYTSCGWGGCCGLVVGLYLQNFSRGFTTCIFELLY